MRPKIWGGFTRNCYPSPQNNAYAAKLGAVPL